MTAPARQQQHHSFIEPPQASELGDFARVLKAASGMLVAYWDQLGYAPGHPYRAALRMVVAYLERRYGV